MFITRRHRDLLLAASVSTLLLVMLGGIVCVTGASKGCPDWPGCYGRALPPSRFDSILEYAHRVLAALTTLIIIASAIVGWIKARSIRWVSWPPLIAIVFLVDVIILGALVVLRGLERGLAALDLGSALIVLALMLTATVVAHALHKNPGSPATPSLRAPLARLAFWATIAVFAVLVSGVLVASDGSSVRCLSWPLYGESLVLESRRAWLYVLRHMLAGIATILIFAVIFQAWRARPVQPSTRRAATLVAGLFLLELALGAAVNASGAAIPLLAIYVAVAALLWASLVFLTVLASLDPRSDAAEVMPT